MKQDFTAFKPAIITAVLIVAVGVSCTDSEKEAKESLPPVLKSLEEQQPEVALIKLPSPAVQKIEPLSVQAELSDTGSERVRMTREGLLLDKSERFISEIVESAPGIVRMADATTLAYRLPAGEVYQLPLGNHIFDFEPTSIAGSDEVSVTIYSAVEREQQAAGPVVMQSVQRGGHQPVRIVAAQFQVAQLKKGEVILESETETTYHLPVVITADDDSWTLKPGETMDVSAGDIPYRITVDRSLYIDFHDSNYSNEGPPYLLEYIITQIKGDE